MLIVFDMSGGHFTKKTKLLFLRKISTGAAVEVQEKVSPFTSTTSKDPLLISKIDSIPKEEGKSHPTDRIVKVIQIQTGGGKANLEDSGIDKQESDTEESSSSSSISLDYEEEPIRVENCSESTKRKEDLLEEEGDLEVQSKDKQQKKKLKTYDFHCID